jgi:transcriptional regulator with XRE-family HTH domain
MSLREKTELIRYLDSYMAEHHLSQRALATQSGVASSTISRMMRGLPADAETYQKLADYLSLPLDSIYRMAGIFPAEESQREGIIRVIEHLAARLPESDQQEILAIIRMKIERQKKDQADT